MSRVAVAACIFLGCAALVSGCKSTPDGAALTPAQMDSVVLPGNFDDVWQATRLGLSQQGYEIYTRDKRGLFVVHTKVRRRLFLFPNRTQLTVTLEQVSADATRVTVETLKQGYRVTLLTYPDWRDSSKPADGDAALALLESIRSALADGGEGTGVPA